MEKEESKSKYLRDDNFLAEHNNPDWCDGISEDRSLREIAYQLKRIADLMEEKNEEM